MRNEQGTSRASSGSGPIGIIAAMPEEASALAAALDSAGARVAVHGRREFRVGRMGREDVVLVVSRVGKVAAAATAAELVVRFGVSGLVCTGVAGGLGDGVAIGDLVVAEGLIQHDLDASPVWPRHVVPLLEVAEFRADAAMSERLHGAASAFAASETGSGRRVHRGLVASGDRFVSSSSEASAIRGLLPGVLCVEMEGAAVAQVAFEHGVPFGVVRAISDRADDSATGDYAASLGAFAASYSLGVLSRFAGA